jgi:hypothetical protein
VVSAPHLTTLHAIAVSNASHANRMRYRHTSMVREHSPEQLLHEPFLFALPPASRWVLKGLLMGHPPALIQRTIVLARGLGEA